MLCKIETVRDFRTVSIDVAEADSKEFLKLQAKYKSEVFRHQQDNQEKDRIIRQKDSIINDYRERLGHYLSALSLIYIKEYSLHLYFSARFS